MANPEQNWEGRDIDSRGPKFRIDVNNPEMGDAGKNAYLQVGTTENDTTQFCALSETGTYMIHNEKSIEIVSAEPTSSNTAITINAQKGNFEIIVTDGQVKIKGSSIVMEAATDITMKAGRNISLNAGQNITLKGIKASASALVGNLVHATGSFIEKVYKPTKVGTDYLRNPPALDPFLKKGVVPGIGDVEDLKSFAEENVGELKSVAKDVGDQLKSAAKDFNVDDIKKSFDVDSIKKLF